MEEQFPVNSGNVPPPSQSTNLLSQQLANFATFQQNSNGQRRKLKETQRTIPKLKLERVLGLTSTSTNILATTNDLVAYAAGAVVVIYNHKRNKQVALLYPPPQLNNNVTNNNNNIVNNSTLPSAPLVLPLGGNNNVNNELLTTNQTTTNTIGDDKKSTTPASNRAKPISCLTFSPDGNYLAVGEMGHQPRILIWNIKEKKLIAEFKSHKFGVLSLAFSPNMRYLVSIGFQHDGYLYVWDWKKGIKLAGNKVTSRVNAVSFSKDGSYFVTAGLRHVKFWYLDARGRIPKRGNLSSRETQVLDGRSGILGVLRDANFVDVACDQSNNTGYTYFITDVGILCIFKEGRVIDKWVDLQVKNAFSIAVSSNYVICTCSEGVIRLFDLITLKYAGILPKPHPLGTDISLVTSPDMVRSADSFYPDAVAMVYNETSQRVISVYSDRSLYIWDIHDLKKIGKYRSFIFHSDCVWGVEPCPNIVEKEDTLPFNSFATFSSDGTVRIWNLDTPNITTSTSTSPLLNQQSNSGLLLSPSLSTTVIGSHRRNIYSRELVKMIYVDPDAAEFAKLRGDFEFTDDQCPDFGIRSLKMSWDGQMMASGDRSGNLRVHDMNTWELLTYQEAHDSEILSIDLTTPTEKNAPSLIATASRDRLLHIFDIKSKFQLVQSLDDHSSSITAVKFSKDSNRLISCGADKGIIFRQRTNPVTPFHYAAPRPYSTYHNYSGRSTVFDMALDVNGRYVATVTGERKLYVLSVESGKPFRICKPETPDEVGKYSENSGGSLINIDLDPFSGTYAVTSGSDRCIRLFDLTNSTCIEKICAHSELITAVKFIKTNTERNGLRIVSTCSDGTIFIWKVSSEITSKMFARANERDLKMKQQDESMSFIQQQQNKRIRTVSSAIRPTASISQMIRQGERKTFSTMSPAEQKYDEVYKKILRKSSIESSAEIPPGSPTATPNRNLLNSKDKKEGRKSPPGGKLDRLYNGLPTSYGRNQILTPPNYRQQQAPVSPSVQRNPILRRAVSKDAILATKKESDYHHHRTKSPTKTTPFLPKPQKEVRRSSQPAPAPPPPLNRRVSDPQTVISKSPTKILEEDSDNEVHTEEEEDPNTEEDEDEEEEEEEIIFTPEQEKTMKPFEVSTHQHTIQTSCDDDEEEDDDGRNTPISDNETHTTSNINDEESSEDNVDDEINRDIIAREPPRVSTSISRTTSISRRKSSHLESPLDEPVPMMPSSPPCEEFQDLKSSAAFKEIKKKLEKASKRQSITTRFLSSLGVPKDAIRPSLDHVMNTFKENTADKLTIDVAPPIKEPPSTLINESLDKMLPVKGLPVKGLPVKELPVKELPVEVPPVKEVPVKEVPVKEAPVRDVPIREIPVKEIPIKDEVDTKLENALADLEGVSILLESVLETYLSTVKSKANQASLSIIETKLSQVSDKITQSIPQPAPPKESPETMQLLERYSSLLLTMIENKIKK